jgi:hypothetical protein
VAIKLQEGGITVPGTMTVSNQLNVGSIAEITGATKLKSTLDVTGVAEITGATKLKSTLDVTGNITGKTIKELQDKITALEEKLNNIFNGNIKGSLTIEGNLGATRLDANSTIPGGNTRYVFNVWGGRSNSNGDGNRILVYPDTLEPNKFYNLFTTRYWQPNVEAANCDGPTKYNCK